MQILVRSEIFILNIVLVVFLGNIRPMMFVEIGIFNYITVRVISAIFVEIKKYNTTISRRNKKRKIMTSLSNTKDQYRTNRVRIGHSLSDRYSIFH